MPDWKKLIRERLNESEPDAWLQRGLVEELAQHLQDRYEAARENGMTESEARKVVMDELNESSFAVRGKRPGIRRERIPPKDRSGSSGMVSGLWQDIQYGCWMLIKNPGFSLVALTALALGIGASTAIFSVVNAVLIRPLPYRDPQQLVLVRVDWKGLANAAGIAPAEILDLRRKTDLFQGFEEINPNDSSLTGDPMEKIPSATVTEGFFSLLGVNPLLGTGDSRSAPAAPRNIWDVVISYELWQSRFGGDPGIIGRTISVNNKAPAVLGVLPKGFGIHLNEDSQIPEHIDLFFIGNFSDDGVDTDRSDHSYIAIGRLKPGANLRQAQSQIDSIAEQLTQQYPNMYAGTGFKLHLAPLQNDLVRQSRPAILVLTCAVGFLLLIACANVANLLLARTDARLKELTVRRALGAAPGRIVRQLITENIVLALAAGAVGVCIAFAGARLLSRFGPANLPRLDSVSIDGPVLGVAISISLLAGVLFGLAPALQSLRTDATESLKRGGGQSTLAHNRLRNSLVIVEIALSLPLMIGTGLLIRTFSNLNHFNWGFDDHNLLSLQVDLNPSRFAAPARRYEFYSQVLSTIQSLPGVESTSGAYPLPLKNELRTTTYSLSNESTALPASLHSVLPGYFSTMGIKMAEGRDFVPDEIANGLPVAIVDSDFASASWPGQRASGKKLLWQPGTKAQKWLEVVGTVEHVRESGIHDPAMAQIYVPYRSSPWYDLSMVVRCKTDPTFLGQIIKKRVEALGGERPVHTIKPMTEYVANQLAGTRFALTLIGALAVIALTLCLVGLYSVIAYSISRRTQEIGIRMALGAAPNDVTRMVVRQGMLLVLTGLVAGLALAVATMRLFSTFLLGVRPTDPASVLGAAALLSLVAMLACYLPARTAAKLDPMLAVRRE